MIRKRYTAVENWLWDNLAPAEADSASQTYDRMLLQGAGRLPVINTAMNLREPDHFADEALVQALADAVREAPEVLDIGTGDGWPALRIAPYVRQVIGIDASFRRVEVSKANAERLHLNNVRFAKMSATALDLGTGSFGAVLAASSIEQTPNPIKALEEIYRVLRPEGRLIVLFESLDVELDRALVESVTLREHFDGTSGWHYCLKHRAPPWERNYMVSYKSSGPVAEAFARTREVISQAGDNPTAASEIGIGFLETTREHAAACTYYELEHFTTASMVETLEEIGFTGVRPFYSPARLARLVLSGLSTADLTDLQLQELARSLGQAAWQLTAPLDQGQPVTAVRPERQA